MSQKSKNLNAGRSLKSACTTSSTPPKKVTVKDLFREVSERSKSTAIEIRKANQQGSTFGFRARLF